MQSVQNGLPNWDLKMIQVYLLQASKKNQNMVPSSWFEEHLIWSLVPNRLAIPTQGVCFSITHLEGPWTLSWVSMFVLGVVTHPPALGRYLQHKWSMYHARCDQGLQWTCLQLQRGSHIHDIWYWTRQHSLEECTPKREREKKNRFTTQRVLG